MVVAAAAADERKIVNFIELIKCFIFVLFAIISRSSELLAQTKIHTQFFVF
jgi:hypothetical protein